MHEVEGPCYHMTSYGNECNPLWSLVRIGWPQMPLNMNLWLGHPSAMWHSCWHIFVCYDLELNLMPLVLGYYKDILYKDLGTILKLAFKSFRCHHMDRQKAIQTQSQAWRNILPILLKLSGKKFELTSFYIKF